MTTRAYGAHAADQKLEPINISRRSVGEHDVKIDIAFCGVCHSDLHQVRSEWGGTIYPCIPGHEIVGHVSEIGEKVTRWQIGDLVGVGCMVDSCKQCAACEDGDEQYCEHGATFTYNAPTKDAPGHTFGGFSEHIVVSEEFVLRVSHPVDQLAAVAPLLCAGITTYSPLRHWRVGPGMRVGIVGVGGLGHMGIKLSHAMGAHTVAFTTSEGKRDAALALGADEVVVSANEEEMIAQANSFDFILNTVAASHNLDRFTALLKRNGTMTLVGNPEHPHPTPETFQLIWNRRSLSGSMIGGIAETQEMLDFCAERGIVADIELIRADEIETAFERMQRSDVRYRFVIETATLSD